jgi:flagella basal body P-ring formation protein FlgA
VIALLCRFLPALAVLLPHVATAAAAGASGEPIVPRASVTVSGPALHLGDLFTNVGDQAGKRIGTTPPPGTPLTIDASTLQRIASANGLPWRPTSMQDQTVVARDSVAITADQLAEDVLAALVRKGEPAEGLAVDLTLGSRQYYRPTEGAVQIDSVTVDKAGVRFGAILAVVTPGEARQTFAVTGRLRRTVGVPVLLRPLRAGEAIDDDVIGWAEVSEQQVSSTAVRNRDALIGMSARRALAAGAPVLVSDLRATTVVGKGQPVTVLLEVGGLHLSARGTAMQDGAVGDTIAVQNTRSKATIQGVVVDGSTVQVPSASVAR